MFESLRSLSDTEEGRGGLIVPLGQTVYMVRVKERMYSGWIMISISPFKGVV